MSNDTIQIVDRGRGPQLSTSRVTVQDLVPYFLSGCKFEEITRWLPTLTSEELAVVEQYYREHKVALDEQDRRVREFREAQIQRQRSRFPESQENSGERFERLRKLLEEQTRGQNGERHPG